MSSDNLQNQLNFLLPSKATLDVIGAETFSLTVQEYKIPRIMGYIAEQPTPKLTIPVIGNKVVYDILETSFLVSEQLESFIDLHSWMKMAYAPHDTNEYDKNNAYREIILTIYSAQNNPLLKITFEKAFPVKLDEIAFDMQIPTADPVKCRADFAYKNYTISKM